MLRALLALSVLVLMHIPIRAEEAQKQPEAEKLPAPKKKVEAELLPLLPRQDTRDIWQHYAVGPRGRFVPRIIVTPFGPLYSRDLSPYPWIQNRTTAIMPYAVD